MKYLEDRKDLEIETRLSSSRPCARRTVRDGQHARLPGLHNCFGRSAQAERSVGQLRPLWFASVPRTRACRLRTGGRLSLAPASVGALCVHAFASRRSERGQPRPDQRRVYTPVRTSADEVLSSLQATVQYVSPTQPAELSAKITRTRAIYLQSPSSLTFQEAVV